MNVCLEVKCKELGAVPGTGYILCKNVPLCVTVCRPLLLPWFDRQLQPGPRRALQIHPGSLQDRPDQGGGAHLSREQLLRPRTHQELPQGLYASHCKLMQGSGLCYCYSALYILCCFNLTCLRILLFIMTGLYVTNSVPRQYSFLLNIL